MRIAPPTFVGDGVGPRLVARAFGVGMDDPSLQLHVEALVRYYEAHPVEHTTWMPGAQEALDASSHLPGALITSKARPITLAILDALGLRPRFAFVYAGGDGPLKPSAEPVLTSARALDVETSALWVVGDGAQDVGAARAAGAYAVGVLGGFASEESLLASAPDVVLRSIDELARLLRG